MAPIQHTVFFKFPDLVEGSAGHSAMLDVVEDGFNSLDGILAQFFAHGTGVQHGAQVCANKAELLTALEWPDKTNDFTHCLLVIARDTASLKAYLHSDFHLKDWMAAVKPFGKGLIVFDNELAAEYADFRGRQIVHPVLFKFPAIEGQVPPDMEAVVAKFNTLPGIAAGFRPHGATGLSKPALLSALDWPDKTADYTHCLTVLATDSTALKGYLHSAFHLEEWMAAVKPFAKGLLVFDTKLAVKPAALAQVFAGCAAPAAGGGGGSVSKVVVAGGVLLAAVVVGFFLRARM